MTSSLDTAIYNNIPRGAATTSVLFDSPSLYSRPDQYTFVTLDKHNYVQRGLVLPSCETPFRVTIPNDSILHSLTMQMESFKDPHALNITYGQERLSRAPWKVPNASYHDYYKYWFIPPRNTIQAGQVISLCSSSRLVTRWIACILIR